MTTHTPWTTESLFEALKHIKLGGTTCLYTREKCEAMAPKINQINTLKAEKNAIILAHSYVSPEIIHTLADFSGDSYELSKKAKATNADTIIFCAVKFMAETAKLLNPSKKVVIPSELNGCSLADSITKEQVNQLRKTYPKATFVCYINTTAAVKAACDVCVTSSNVYDIIEHIPNDEIYFLPDKLMGMNVINELKRRGSKKNIRIWDGTCYVHEEYDPDLVNYIRSQHPGVSVVSHPECHESIISLSDFVGSTSQMLEHVRNTKAPSYFMLTECGLTSRLQLEDPKKAFVGSCTLCKYMKANNLDDILTALQEPRPESIIEIDPRVAKEALDSITAMFDYHKKSQSKKSQL